MLGRNAGTDQPLRQKSPPDPDAPRTVPNKRGPVRGSHDLQRGSLAQKTVVIGGAAPLLHRAKAPGGGTRSRPSVTGVTAGQAWTGTALSSPATARATAACSRSALLRPAECTNCIETRGRTPLTREEDKVGSMAVTRGLDRLRQNC